MVTTAAVSEVLVDLTYEELFQAASIGCLRMVRALKKGRSETYGHPVERGAWDVVIEGAAAEMAVAKALGLFWSDSIVLDYAGDVRSYQVRSTDLGGGGLLLYERDSDEAVFVFVTGTAPRFTIRGWIVAREGKTDAYWRSDLRTPCWRVPASVLHSIKDIQ